MVPANLGPPANWLLRQKEESEREIALSFCVYAQQGVLNVMN